MTFPSLRQFAQIAKSQQTGTLHLNPAHQLAVTPTGNLGNHTLAPLAMTSRQDPLFLALENAALTAGYSGTALAALQLPPAGQDFSPSWLQTQLQHLEMHTNQEILTAARPNATNPEIQAAVSAIIKHRLELPDSPAVQLIQTQLEAGIADMLRAVTDVDQSIDFRVLTQAGQALADTLLTTTSWAFEALTKGQNRERIGNKELGAMVADLQTPKSNEPRVLQNVRSNLNSDLAIQTRQFTTNINTLMNNVKADLGAINRRFFADDAGPAQGLTDLQLTNSDPHKNGQRVAILTFNNGQKIVFKPRDARIDEAIVGRDLADGGRSALEILEANRPHAENQRPLPGMRFLHRNSGGEDAYSYQTHLSNKTAADHLLNSPQEAQAYYRELGTLAFAAAIAGATDLHHENVMTSGGQPHLTDLEIAGSGHVLSELRATLRGEPANILSATMIDKVFGSRMSTPQDGGPFAFTPNGLVRQQAQSEVVLESLVAVRHEDGLRDNRTTDKIGPGYSDLGTTTRSRLRNLFTRPAQTAPVERAPDHSFSTTYGGDFAQGFMAAAKSFPADDLAEFHARISGFKMRMHPMATAEHYTIVNSYRGNMDLEPSARRERAEASYLRQLGNFSDSLGTRQTHAPLDAETRAQMSKQLADQVTNFDVPYNSHVPNQTGLGFDKSGPTMDGVFQPADLHTAELTEALRAVQADDTLAERAQQNMSHGIREMQENTAAVTPAYTKLREELEQRANVRPDTTQQRDLAGAF